MAEKVQAQVPGSEALTLTILAPQRKLIDRHPVDAVTLTGSEGEIQILPGHANMLGTVDTGRFAYVTTAGGETTEGFASTGFFEVNGNHVTLTAEVLELKGEIDLSRAQDAQRRAETELKNAALDEHAFRKYQLKLQRSLVRQQIAGRS